MIGIAERVAEVQTDVLSLELLQTPGGFLCRRLRPGSPAESKECSSVFDVQDFFGRGPVACHLYREWLGPATVGQ
jgi:hypothetical protein